MKRGRKKRVLPFCFYMEDRMERLGYVYVVYQTLIYFSAKRVKTNETD